MLRPQRPWLSHTSYDGRVIPLVALLATALPFSQYLPPADTTQQTYNAQRLSTAGAVAPASVPAAPVEQNSSASSSRSEAPQAPEPPVAAAHQGNNSGAVENAGAPVQLDRQLPMMPTSIAESPKTDADQYGDPSSDAPAWDQFGNPVSRLNESGPGAGGGTRHGNGHGDGSGSGDGHEMGGGACHIGCGVSAPTLISKTEPEYSEEARKAKYCEVPAGVRD